MMWKLVNGRVISPIANKWDGVDFHLRIDNPDNNIKYEQGNLPLVVDVVNKWGNINTKDTIDRDEATIFFDSGEEK